MAAVDQIALVQFPLQFICLVHFPIQSWVIQQVINIRVESNPTRDRLEQLIAGLEEGKDALAFSSGMAAVDAVFHLFSLETISFWVMICMVALSACSQIFTNKTALSSPMLVRLILMR